MKASSLFAALMESLKLHAVASYLFLPAGRPLPFAASTAGLLSAFALGGFFRAHGGRVVYRLLAHALGMGLFFIVLYNSFRGASAFELDFAVPDGGGTVPLVSVAAAALVFWLRGEIFGRKPPNHPECVTLFDKGLGIFLAAFSIAALTRIENPFPARLVVPYFLFGILALGLSRGETAKRGGLDPRPARAALLPTAGAFALAAAGVYFLMPSLFEPAALAGRSLKNALIDIRPYLASLLKWLFGFGRSASAAAAAAPTDNGAALPTAVGEPGYWEKLIVRMLMWGLGALAVALFLALAAYFLAKLIKFLASRVEGEHGDRKPPFPPRWLRGLLLRCARFLARLEAALSARRKKRSAAVSAYAKLLSCGRTAGAARKSAETPGEYARRLSTAFPRAARDARFVAAAVENEIYGGMKPDGPCERRLAEARRRATAAEFVAEGIAGAWRRRSTQERPKGRKTEAIEE